MAPSDKTTRIPDFPGLTRQFLHVTPEIDGDGGARVLGTAVLPGLPPCHVEVAADAARIARGGPGRQALIDYVRVALCEDVGVGLPWN